uniref:Uncharacterized protein n=1 Tax=Rhizophora mucronata TaxID=61149 RepID=A0A2P2IR00_RHIMU
MRAGAKVLIGLKHPMQAMANASSAEAIMHESIITCSSYQNFLEKTNPKK